MKRPLNNKQDAVAASDGVALTNENEKENLFKIAKKKKHVAFSGSDAGTMLSSAPHADDPHAQSHCTF
jgi:hypothetical protein